MAYVPAIPGCHAWGQTPGEAQTELINVFKMIEEEYKEEGRMLSSDVGVKATHACQS
ncbi:MAG: type II toxin-antitoxin system HicB family antitoxin [Methanothrix sp.]|nr:type II toxin-antitoxin system HicB family antitoxin [Methanothrix sp.]